ncbi:hypothetical protein HY383_04105 [Candidatus Daviesbacteria bacterium]|nr:hypothetical protein [Candidatus Daviesbacteria bacterium]
MGITEVPRALVGRIFQPHGLTLAEQDHKRETLLKKHPLSNAGLWLAVILDRGLLRVNEVGAITQAYDLYRKISPDIDVSLSELFTLAHLPDPPKDKIYRHVCFNYEVTFDVGNRFNRAIDEIRERKIIDGNDFWTTDMWVNQDFRRLLSDGVITAMNMFNTEINAAEYVYKLTPYCSYSTYLRNYHDLKNAYRKAVYLLGPDEIFKASSPNQFSSYDWYYSPSISKGRTALPPDRKIPLLW